MLVERKNRRVRKALIDYGVDQRRLSAYMGITETECSVMLKRELAKFEQDDLIKKIREIATS